MSDLSLLLGPERSRSGQKRKFVSRAPLVKLPTHESDRGSIPVGTPSDRTYGSDLVQRLSFSR